MCQVKNLLSITSSSLSEFGHARTHNPRRLQRTRQKYPGNHVHDRVQGLACGMWSAGLSPPFCNFQTPSTRRRIGRQ